jgi:hypothetical protein
MKLKIIAMLMILLIVAMPIGAFSGIISYDISGKDGVNKVARENDVLNVEAVVSIEGDDKITADQIWLGGNIQFDSCIADINGYLCKLTYPKTGDKSFNDREPFAINLHEDDHSNPPTSYSIIDSETGYIITDNYPPRLELAETRNKVVDTLYISFNAYDDSYALNNYEECAGLKSIELYTKDKQVDKIFDYDVNTCTAQESFDLDVGNLVDGSYVLKIDALDYLDQKAEYTIDFEVDKTGATFNNLRLLDIEGNQINNVGYAPLDVFVLVEVGDDIKPSTVKGDFSSLNDKQDYSNLAGDYLEDQGEYQWEIEIVPTAYGSKEIVIKGEDIVGNANEQKFTVLIQRDIEGPRALVLNTQTTGSNNVKYLRPYNNTIEVSFAEAGAGLDTEDVLLDLSSLGGPRNLKASYCEQGWKCVWEDLNFAGADGQYIISINPDTKDKVGNKLKQTFSQAVVLDNSAPSLVSIDVTEVGGLESYGDIIVLGDSLQVVAQVYEPGELTDAYGDFSPFVSDAYMVQADNCNDKGDGLWECTWITDAINKEGYINDKVRLSFKDYQGSIAEYTKDVTAYGIKGSYTDYWQHNVVCSPSNLDKEVMSLIDQKVYCKVGLAGKAEVVSMDMVDCTGEGSKYVRKQELLNKGRDPYIKLTLNSADVAEESLSLTCPLVIISKFGNTITSIPEVEEVSIDLPFYNNPLGEYGENVQEKIDDALEDATGGIWPIITSLKNILFYAERICNLITTVNRVASFFSMVGEIQKNSAELLAVINPAGSKALSTAGIQQQSVAMQINNKLKDQWLGEEGSFINKFCKFISCRLYYDDVGWTGEIGKDIGDWQRGVLEYANLVATGGELGEQIGLGGKGVNAYTFEGTDERGGTNPKVLLQGGKLNPKDSIVLSFATLCIPGIIYHLDKYRQIKCMYADCLQTSVETGVPIAACEDSKEYETCKYIYGEVFQLMPFTGLFNYFIGLVKGVLYSPFGVVDLVLGYVCQAPVNSEFGGSVARLCLWQEMAGVIADVWSDISNIKDDWAIRSDYCSRIKAPEEEDEEQGNSGGFLGGLFG